MKHYNVKSYARTPEIQELPSLIDIQLKSFEDFLYRGRLLELFDEINPIQSFNGNLSLYFPGNIPAAKEFDLRCEFSEPKYDEDACLERDISYAAPLHVYVALVNHEQGDEVIRQKIFLGDFPLMTEKGTFIINGTERVVVSQLIRSPGVYFDAEEERATGRLLSNCKLIPDRGAWMEFETRKTDYITLKFNRKRTVPVTMLLRALAAVDDGLPAKRSPIKTGEDDEIRRLFAHVDTNEAHPYIESSIKNEPEWDVKKKQTIAEVALIEFYKRMRPGDPATLDNAREYLHSQLFDKRRYDLERVGRYKLNQRLDLADKINPSHRTITKADIVALVEQMIIINNGQRGRDDIDHLGNRRVKTVGELVGNKLRIGLRRMERLVKERMSIREAEQLAPVSLVNIRPVVAAVKEFFGSSQLSQFMEQTNPLSELTHKRTLSALGPGGLRRERAGFDVRDVHNSHYGRICPIETPEGPNIGLIGRLASYARVNELGFVETPYRKVVNKMPLFQTQQVRTSEESAVSRRRSRLQNATRTLLGREVNEDVEVEIAESSFNERTNEISKGGGIRSELTKYRGKGEFPDGKTVQRYGAHISDIGKALDPYLETRKSAIEHLQRHPAVDEFNVSDEGFLDLQTLVKAYIEAFTELLSVVPSDSTKDASLPDEYETALDQALKAADQLHNAKSRFDRDVQRKIDEANSHLPAEDKVLMEDGVSRRVIAQKGDIVDEDILNALVKHGIKQLRMVSYVSRKELIGDVVYSDVQDDDGNVIVEEGTVIDAEILKALMKAGIRKIKVASSTDKESDNPDLIGHVVRDDIEVPVEHTIVKEGTVIDADIVETLKKYGEQFEAVSPIDNPNLPGCKVTDDIKLTIEQTVKKGTVIDAKVVKKLKEHDIKEVGVVFRSSKKVDDTYLSGCKVTADIKASIEETVVKKGTVIDAKVVKKLKEHGIKEISVVKIVPQQVTRTRNVSKVLLERVAADDVEVEIAVPSFDERTEEISKGDGILSELTEYRGKGESPDGETVQRYEAHISDIGKALDPYLETRKSAIEHLRQHPDVKEKVGDEFSVPDEGFLDLQTFVKAYIEAFTEFLSAVPSDSTKGAKTLPDEYKAALNQALMRTRNLTDAKSRFDRDVQRKIDEANSHLPAEDKVPMEDGVSRRVIVKKGDIVDENILSALMKHGIKQIKVVERDEVEVEGRKKVDDPDLIEGKVTADIKASVKQTIVKKGAVIDDKIIKTLKKHGIKKAPVVSDTIEVDDPDLIGCKVTADIKITVEQTIVEEGAVIDAEIIKTLKKHGIKEVKVAGAAGDQDLIGCKVADDVKITVEEIIVEEGAVIDAEIIKTLKKHSIEEIPVVPFATSDIEYLSADKEDGYRIAQANSLLDQRNQFVSDRISARHKQGFHTVRPERIDYMDVAPRQIVGISAALIPFLSHDDANRALMGSNMQRQAVPLIAPDVSVVSTGMEKQAASDSGQVLLADIEAEVVSVQGHRVTVKTAKGKEHHYALRKYDRSNQSTCIDQRPLVRKGDVIKPDDVIADSSSTYNGELALGHDVLTCFLSWDGGNYEDALLISEDMLRNDKFTSIHIEKHEIEARDTKLGPEEITYDIPNVGEETLKDLDERGIVRIGAEVGPNDILVGKITPKGEKELSPEEKLLRAIFGEQAREVKDSSLRLPHGDRGKVVDVKVFTRDEHPDLPAGVEKMVRVSVAQRRKLTVGDKMAGRHGNKGVISKIVPIADMPYIEGGVPVEIILNPLGVPGRMNIGQILELHLGWAADRLGFRAVTPVFDGAKEHEIQAELGRAWMMDWAWKMTAERAWENHERLAEMGQIAPEDFDDDMHVICAYLVDRVGESGRYDNEAIILERSEVYVRRVAVAEALRGFGYDPDEMMVYDNADLPLETRDRRDMKALEVSLRLWIQQNSPQGIELEESLEIRNLFEIADQVMFETGRPVPHYGKQTLYDGRTGEAFDRHVAVGYVHMLKLAHLVEDKAHARSTGPYSLVTQQPLGGKAQFGGQRFGEMEVWALEAYGAAYILQEMLTVKSDDVLGRVKTYESIVKGEPIEEPGIPTSFRVLVKELQSLGLAVEAITGNGDVIRFGKNEEHTRRPQPETGLLRFSAG